MADLTISLQQFDQIPNALFDCGATGLELILGGPSLFQLKGRRAPPLFVTVLQHGNEPTGFEAVQAILRKYRGQDLPRAMWLFIANVSAARHNLRVLDHQTDYNRAWPGTTFSQSNEAALMQQVVSFVTAEPLFASIDLHNNTGANPHYACLNELDPPFLHLAALFARTAVYYRQPVGTQSLAMSIYCPAVTLECGKAGQNAALEHAVEYLDACLHMQSFPRHNPMVRDINLLRTKATVKVKPGVAFGFIEGVDNVQLLLRDDLDHFNFGMLKKGDVLGKLRNIDEMPISVFSDSGADIADELFRMDDGCLKVRENLIPSMATLDVDVIRQDCLFYLMAPMKFPAQ